MYTPPPAPKKHNPVLWIIFAVIGIPILFCGGCFALIGNSASSSSHKSTTTSTPTHSVTPVYTSAYTPPPAQTTAKKALTLTDEEIADAAYILALDSEKIHYSTKAAAIKLAHTVCDAMREGASELAAGAAIAANSPYTLSEAGYITGAAIAAYCPEFK
ncbi:DUF732 domain-containing protein [Nocardia sp. NPDC004711]